MNEKTQIKKVRLLNKQISHLRAYLYLSLAVLALLACLGVYWINTTYTAADNVTTFYSSPTRPPKAALYLSPQTGNYRVGDEFTVDVLINTQGNNVVAASAHLSYSKDKFEVKSLDTSKSVFSMQAERDINNEEGKIIVTLGKPTPGAKAYSGLMATIHFKALQAVTPYIENIYFDFTKDSSLYSSVILDDKKGTNILDATRGARITIN